MLGRSEKFPSVILRFFLVYGPGQAINRFIPQIISGCLNDEAFDTSSGGQLRDFCHIDDIVKGVFCALEHRGLYGEVVNLASGQPVKIRYIVDLIQRLVGAGRPNFGRVPYRSNENMALYADISKAKKLLSWSPLVSLEDGISKLINQ
jgi:nucleoside-diphosphate-sugar epimerase